MVLLLKYSLKSKYMAGAGVGVGAEIMDTGGAGAEYKSLWLRNTG